MGNCLKTGSQKSTENDRTLGPPFPPPTPNESYRSRMSGMAMPSAEVLARMRQQYNPNPSCTRARNEGPQQPVDNPEVGDHSDTESDNEQGAVGEQIEATGGDALQNIDIQVANTAEVRAALEGTRTDELPDPSTAVHPQAAIDDQTPQEEVNQSSSGETTQTVNESER